MEQYLNPATIANNVRMHRTQFSGSYLIVEGSKDSRLYRNHIDESACHISVALSKSNAIGALEILNAAKFPGVLAIVDSDFEKIEGTKRTMPNLLYTDHHDLEAMLFSSHAFEKVLAEFGATQKIKTHEELCGSDIRTLILNLGGVIGALRLASQRRHLALDFKGLVYSNFIDEKTLRLDLSKLIKAVKNNSNQHQLAEEQLKADVSEILGEGNEPLQVCVGHDLTQILALGFRKAIGTNNAIDVKPESIEKLLRLSYEQPFFQSTELYASILDWQRNNPPFRITP